MCTPVSRTQKARHSFEGNLYSLHTNSNAPMLDWGFDFSVICVRIYTDCEEAEQLL